MGVAVAVNDQVNDNAYVNDHTFRTVLLETLPCANGTAASVTS